MLNTQIIGSQVTGLVTILDGKPITRCNKSINPGLNSLTLNYCFNIAAAKFVVSFCPCKYCRSIQSQPFSGINTRLLKPPRHLLRTTSPIRAVDIFLRQASGRQPHPSKTPPLQDQACEQVAFSDTLVPAFSIATVLTGIWQKHPKFGEVFLAHLHRRCPYTIPAHWTRRQGEETTEYLKYATIMLINNDNNN